MRRLRLTCLIEAILEQLCAVDRRHSLFENLRVICLRPHQITALHRFVPLQYIILLDD